MKKNKFFTLNGLKQNFITLCFFTLIICLWGCKNKVVYHQYKSTPIAGWERNDTLSYSIPPLSKSGLYNICVGLRVNGAYPFTKLTLVVEKTVLPYRRTYTDTVLCSLRDSHGNVLGKGISYYQYEFNASTLRLQKGDSLHLTIKHGMKREILPGVSDIGVKLSTR